MQEYHYIGIEIGGTKLQLVIGDAALQVKARMQQNVRREEGAEGIRQQIARCLPVLREGRPVAAIGVGFGGPINRSTGRISTSHQISGWTDFNLVAWLQDLAGVPVVADNDANVAALGEAVHGAGIGSRIVFYITLGSGIGGGLVVDQEIYHGAFPGEAEVGHLRLDKEGNTLESLCSGWAVDQQVRAAIQRDPACLLAQLAGRKPGGEAWLLPTALQHHDAAAHAILDQTTDHLAFALSHVVHLFHPERIVMGGGLSLVGAPLLRGVSAALPKYLMKIFLPGPGVRLAALGTDAVPVGALELARRAHHLNR